VATVVNLYDSRDLTVTSFKTMVVEKILAEARFSQYRDLFDQ
jgi:hypothetical protein